MVQSCINIGIVYLVYLTVMWAFRKEHRPFVFFSYPSIMYFLVISVTLYFLPNSLGNMAVLSVQNGFCRGQSGKALLGPGLPSPTSHWL